MAAANRAALFTTCHKVVKKHYEPAQQDSRPILEQMIFAAILENAPRDIAETSYANLRREYVDWNEIRVTSIAELSELFADHPQPQEAARGVKTILQNVFEGVYLYDLEILKKGNQGKAIIQIENFGASPFVVGYTTQHGLGGHSIPVDTALLRLALILGAITEKEAKKKSVPGIERAIPKTKGIEFASLIHELAVEYRAQPHSKKVREIVLEIAPDAAERFPKRSSQKKGESGSKKAGDKKKAVGKGRASKPAASKPTAKKANTAKTNGEKSPAARSPTKKGTPKAAERQKSTPAKKATRKSAKSSKPASDKKSTTKKSAPKKAAATKSSSRLTKKKPK